MMTAYPVPTFEPTDIYVRSTNGDLNGPYLTVGEAVTDHLDELPKATVAALRTYVCRKGWVITDWYGDGAIRVAEKVDADTMHPDNGLFVFIRTDGTVSKPRSRVSARYALELRDIKEAACTRAAV